MCECVCVSSGRATSVNIVQHMITSVRAILKCVKSVFRYLKLFLHHQRFQSLKKEREREWFSLPAAVLVNKKMNIH